jgi:hypothetical protein
VAKANKYVVPIAALLVGIGFLVAGSMTAKFDKGHPKPNVVFYGLNGDTGAASWLSTDFLPDEWTSQFFSANFDGNVTAEFLPFLNTPVLTGQAPTVQLAAPAVRVLGDSTTDTLRTISMQITSQRQAPSLVAFVGPETQVVEASVNGKKIEPANLSDDDSEPGGWGLRYYGLPAEGMQLTLKVRPAQHVELRVIDQSYQLPDIPFRPRPDYMQPGQFFYSDTTLVTKSFTLN